MEGQGYHYPNSLFKLGVTIAGHPDVMCVSMWSYMKYTMWSMMYSSLIFDLNLAFETCFQFTGTIRMVRTSQHHHEGATRQIPKMWHFAKKLHSPVHKSVSRNKTGKSISHVKRDHGPCLVPYWTPVWTNQLKFQGHFGGNWGNLNTVWLSEKMKMYCHKNTYLVKQTD